MIEGDFSDIDMVARARQALGVASIASRGPVKVTAATLAGTVDGITYQTTLFDASRVMALRPAAGPGGITLSKPRGEIFFDVTLFPGWSYYVEFDGGVTPAGRPLLWASLVTGQGSSRGTATQDPQTGRWFFTTPAADDRPNGEISIFINFDDGDEDQDFGFAWISLLAVKVEGAPAA